MFNDALLMEHYYEILVPTIHRRTGRPIRTRFHRVWDSKIRMIAGGLTILQPVKGQWMYKHGPASQIYNWMFPDTVFEERMIPVRIACTSEQVVQILKMTKEYYDQIEVFCVKISEEVIRYRG